MGIRDLLQRRDFRTLWLAQAISDFGDNLTYLALLLYVNQVTGSTAAIAMMTFMLALPQLTFGLVAGVYVDRWDRKRIMVLADLGRGLLVLGFVGATLTGQLWLLYGIAFAQAAIGTFFTPARNAVIPALVPPQGLLAANSLAQITRMLMMAAGAGAAGLLIGLLNTSWPVFVLDALTFFVSLLLVLRVAVPALPPPPTRATPRVIGGQLQEGLRVIAGSRILRGTLGVLAVMMLGLGAVNTLLVPLIVNELAVPPAWFGVMPLAQATSTILGAGLAGWLAARFPLTRIVTASLIVLGLCIGMLGAATAIWHLLLIRFAAGWCITPLQATVATILQTNAPNHQLGRIGAAQNTVITTTNLLSMGLAGLFGELVGIRTVFVLAGITTVLAGLGAAWMFRALPAPAAPESPVVSETRPP
jgi:MFS family permease